MRLLIQRVSSASITIDGKASWSIESWLVCYIGISSEYDHNNSETITKAVHKLLNVRLRADESWKLKRSVQDIDGSLLIVSNFTLWGQLKKWTALDFSKSGKFDAAQDVYDQFVSQVQERYISERVISWKFWAMMEVESINDWPVNIIIDL